ncbi:DUF6890 family protein [Shewanella algae]|uniref:DUF6890 family protein n=1 Tax=Shewanella algae TaxID=38313 RepID=UPI003D7E6450
MTARAEAIDGNDIEQLLILRRHLLPHEDDSEQSLARASWLYQRQSKEQETIMANAIVRAFSGK